MSLNEILRMGFCPLTNPGDAKDYRDRVSRNRLLKYLLKYLRASSTEVSVEEAQLAT